MLQSWDSFFSPSGGSMENEFQFGTSSLLIGFGVDLFGIPLLKSTEKMELRDARVRRRVGVREAISTGKELGARKGKELEKYLVDRDPSLASDAERSGKILSERATRTRSSRLSLRAQKDYFKSINEIKSKYMGLRGLFRGISFGYLALGAASIVESMATPGVTAASVRSDLNSIGQGPLSDSSQAYTQRRRALMAIHESQLGIRNVIGNEAGSFHR